MKRKKPTVTLVLACYNETLIFAQSVARIREAMDVGKFSYEIMFVDDASTDGTQDLIRDMCRRVPSYRTFFHPTNQGRGKTVADGIARAKGSVVGYIDIDCEVSPVYIPLLVSRILSKQADIVIGKRYYRTSVSSLLREVLSVGYRWAVSHAFDTRGLDTESGYKFFRKSKILPILPLIRDRHWFWDTEVVVWALRKHARVQEYPVLYLRRRDKKSTVRIIPDTIEYIKQLISFQKRMK